MSRESSNLLPLLQRAPFLGEVMVRRNLMAEQEANEAAEDG